MTMIIITEAAVAALDNAESHLNARILEALGLTEKVLGTFSACVNYYNT